MSLYKDASLVMIPSAYKDNKLYSIRPTDGSGDFTFTRGSNLSATRVNASQLIEKGRENLLLNSNGFTTSWILTGSGSSLGSDVAGPIAGVTGKALTMVTGALLYQTITSIPLGVMSVYMRVSSGTIDLQLGDPLGAPYSTKTLTTTWQRFSTLDTGTLGGLAIYNSQSGTTINIEIAAAQVEQGLVATDYIETGASTAQAGILENTPRLDYSGGASCPSLLLEPQRSNLVTQSEYFGGYFNVTEVNLSYNYAISPDGTLNANKVTFPSTSNSMYKSGLSYSGTHSISFWYKGEGSNVGKTFDVRLLGSSVDQNIDVTLESGWKRFEAQSDGLQTFEITNRSSTTIGAGSLLLYGFQIEAGSYPTSYIPTYGTSVTRSVDDCSATGISSVIGQTQGVIFMDFIWSNSSPTGGDYALMVYGADTADFVSLNANGNTNQMLVYSGGSAVAAIGGGSFVVGQRYKIALVYRENYFAYYINGVLKGTDTSGAVPNNLQSVRTRTPFGLKTSSQKTQQLVFFPTALTDSECIALTTI